MTSIELLTLHQPLYYHIYIYMCVCVCVYVCYRSIDIDNNTYSDEKLAFDCSKRHRRDTEITCRQR
jgi:hypothetical protein